MHQRSDRVKYWNRDLYERIKDQFRGGFFASPYTSRWNYANTTWPSIFPRWLKDVGKMITYLNRRSSYQPHTNTFRLDTRNAILVFVFYIRLVPSVFHSTRYICTIHTINYIKMAAARPNNRKRWRLYTNFYWLFKLATALEYHVTAVVCFSCATLPSETEIKRGHFAWQTITPLNTCATRTVRVPTTGNNPSVMTILGFIQYF